MSKPRDPLDVTKEAIEKALTSNKYISRRTPSPQAHKEKETKPIQDKTHKKTPN